tara:strand:+ start:85 stop:1563 length:1479 start_codon:yes stop_codon:yes gene_type:complete
MQTKEMSPFGSSIVDLVKHLKAKNISAESIIEAVYARIERYNKSLNVFLSLLPKDFAISRARKIDKKLANGENVGNLAGIPISIKDNICISDSDLRNSCGSKILKDFKSPYNATVVEKLLSEDAIIIGTTNMDEFAMGSSTENSSFGATLNPWNKDFVPGGSSGGAAVSVVSGMSLIALGSDTGGSVRQPASMCGVTGFKPTYGTVSRYGLVAYGSSLDQIGVFGQRASDCEYVFDVINGYDLKEATSANINFIETPVVENLNGLNFCIPDEYIDSESIDPEVVSSVNEFADFLSEHGALVERQSFDFLKYVIPTYYLIAFAEASSNLGRFDGVRYGIRNRDHSSVKSLYESTRKMGFGEEVKRRIMLGTFVLSSGYYEQYYGKALKVRSSMEINVSRIFKKYDFILGPVSPFTAFKIGEKTESPLSMYLADIYSVLANLTRTPAISIPGRISKNGLPIGIQIMGRRFEDNRLLSTASVIQSMTDYHLKRPF